MDSPKPLIQQAQLYLDLGDLAAAEKVVSRALDQFADDAMVQQCAGLVRMQQGRLTKAVGHLERAVEMDPSDAVAHTYLGEIYILQTAFSEAEDHLNAATRLQPVFARPHANLGTLWMIQDQFDKAAQAFRDALKLDPTAAEALLGLGNLADAQGDYDEAIACYKRTLEAHPHYPQAVQNLAVVNYRTGKTVDALAGLNEGLAVAPDDPRLRTSRGLMHLMSEDWSASAWQDYEYRLSMPPVSQNTWASWLKLWAGQSLEHEGVVVWMEQGIGDFIVALHALAEVQKKVQNIVVACDLRLEPILSRSFPGVPVISNSDIGAKELSDYAAKYHVPAFEMIRHAYGTPSDIPERRGFLQYDPTTQTELREKYVSEAQGRPIIGLGWQSRKSIHSNDGSVNLTDLGGYLKQTGGYYVSLQYGDTQGDIAALQSAFGIDVVQDPSVDQMTDMDRFTAQVAAMDAVVATGSTVVHVAGALDIPTTVLAHDKSDGLIWHRFQSTARSPWYPSTHILRWSDRQKLLSDLSGLDVPRARNA